MASAWAQGDVRLLTEPGPSSPVAVDHPGLFRAADAAAVAVRRRHYLAEAAQLALTPATAILVVLAAAGLVPMQTTALTAVSTTLVVVVLWMARGARWQQQWHDCRAVAEEVKGLAWRFMMQADPFPPAHESPDVAFVHALDDVLRGHPEARPGLAAHARAITVPVTEGMRRVRALAPEDRAALYLEARVRGERAWYAEKARSSSAADAAWFAGLLAVQVAAVVGSILLAVRRAGGAWTAASFECALPAVVALGGAMMGWTRSRRHAELSSSYASTAHALASLEATCPRSGGPDRLAQWVAAVEDALAHEHEAWRLGS